MGLSDVWKKEQGNQPDPPPQGGDKESEQAPLVGTILADRYRIDQVLTYGGMGVLYLASHLKLHKKFVIKMTLLEKKITADQQLFQRFRREAHAMAQIHHPNVVEIVDYDVMDDRKPYIVMEYVEGENLKQFMDRHPEGLDPKTFMTFMEQICKGLSAIHEAGIVHRDLKPNNVHVTKKGDQYHLKVLDLGLAYYADAQTQTSHQKLTGLNEIVGTPAYMSPEQCKSETVNYLSDVYNLGLLAYELIKGEPAMQSKTLMDIIDKQISWTPTPIHRTDVSPSIEKAIFKAMEKAPENRFQSIKAFWQALQAAGEPAKTGALPSQEEKTLSIKPPRNQNTILIVMALIILALVLLLVLR
ncbi:MAG: serine/threonine protein kinase [Acidobacteria bacterium]|nr:serine/threonine protein kinase [Acidobacteriota bacterium]MCB9398366.1 serine/threonine protein kinase [Acidobacteriota bacterium]